MIDRKERRLVVNVNDLRKKNPVRCQRYVQSQKVLLKGCILKSIFFHTNLLIFFYSLLTASFEELVAFQRALKEFVSAADPEYTKDVEEFFVAMEGRYSGEFNLYIEENKI